MRFDCSNPLIAAASLFLCGVAATQAADFVVTNTNNSGAGSLSQAITDANNTPGADRILFNIPGAGVQKINVGNPPLPQITESLIIDGYTQPGAKPNSLVRGDNAVILIQLDVPDRTADSDGLVFSGLASDYRIQGLSLTRFSAAIRASGVHSAVVTGNFIGLLPDGETARRNRIGVQDVTHLGGIDPADRNIISGNSAGLAITSASPGTAIAVEGNYIGTNGSGTKAVANGAAIILAGSGACTGHGKIDLSQMIIGGTASGAGNVISGNDLGVGLGGYSLCTKDYYIANSVTGVQIKGNLIGLQPDGVTALPNRAAIVIAAATDIQVGGLEPGAGNAIGFNRFAVIVDRQDVNDRSLNQRNSFLSNTIYGSALGIDLGNDGPTPNDTGDSDAGANSSQNYPVIQSAVIASSSVTISGTLNSAPYAQFTLQYFADSLDLLRPVQTYLGTTTVTTDGNGNAPFSGTFPLADSNVSFNMTATHQSGNTSEFSQHAAQMKNISTRAKVGAGDLVPIAGVIAQNAQFLVRALGPSVTGVAGVLADPTLEMHDSTGHLIGSNDNWKDDSDRSWTQEAGLAPKYDVESALWSQGGGGFTGLCTAVVRGAHGTTGTALVEVYQSDARQYIPLFIESPDVAPSGHELLNISTRAFVGTGNDVLIAGTILEPGAGSTRIVVRGIGPSLATAGVTDALSDPLLELHDGQGTTIASNDDWRDGQADALTAVGLAPTSDREAAIFMRLSPGAYTAVVRGKAGATGTALVEMYNLH